MWREFLSVLILFLFLDGFFFRLLLATFGGSQGDQILDLILGITVSSIQGTI